VTRLVQAELMKLRSTRTPLALLLAALGFAALTVVVSVPTADDEAAAIPLDDAGLLAGTVATGFLVPLLLMALLGVLTVTQEHRYGTITSTFLVEPRRPRILGAKWLSMALVSVVVTTATLVLTVGAAVAAIRARGGDGTLGAQFWQTVGAGFVVTAAYGTIGVAVGALVRNQVAAVVGVLVWMNLAEQLLIQAFPAVGRWTPYGTASGALQLGPAYRLDGELLVAPLAGGVLVGWTAAAVVLALVVTPKRDVL
jgi:hypothetical protein